jgi:hypothetical protein
MTVTAFFLIFSKNAPIELFLRTYENHNLKKSDIHEKAELGI